MISVGIIGAGRIGYVRARSLIASHESRLAIVADTDIDRARQVAAMAGAEASANWRDVVDFHGLDAVIIATPTKFHQEIACVALAAGRHVLCEKPLARTAPEAEAMVVAARRYACVLKTGFNYRYMPHVERAKELIVGGSIGAVYYLRCRFGHGGRPGYEKEWHTDKDLSGGGVLLEQGIHILDLVRHLLGEPAEVLGQASRYFWKLRDVEDNFFCLLRTGSGQTADIHVSWTQWVNTLELEIYGQNGYLSLQGRDGHYGPPCLVVGIRRPDHSRPEQTRLEYKPGECWDLEWRDFVHAIVTGAEPMGSAVDGLRAQQVVDAAYASSERKKWVCVPVPESGALAVAGSGSVASQQ